MDALHAPAHENFVATLRQVTALGPNACAETRDGWFLLDAGAEFDSLNVATPAPGSLEPCIDDAIRWFGDRGRGHRLVLREPLDGALIADAARRGYAVEALEPAMTLGDFPAEAPMPAVGMRMVKSAADVNRFAALEPIPAGDLAVRKQITRRAIDIPGCSLVLATVGGAPVARAMSVVTGTLAGVYNVYVAESHRRRGLGRAVTVAALDAARLAGATSAWLASTDAGYNLYLGMGFKPIYRYARLAPTGSAASATTLISP